MLLQLPLLERLNHVVQLRVAIAELEPADLRERLLAPGLVHRLLLLADRGRASFRWPLPRQ